MNEKQAVDVVVTRKAMPGRSSDALVRLHKKAFPGLQSMIPRRNLNMRAIDVVRSGWTTDQLCSRAGERLTQHGGGGNEEEFAQGVELLQCPGLSLMSLLGRPDSVWTSDSPEELSHFLCVALHLHSSSRGENGCADGALSVLCRQFGGHEKEGPINKGDA
jgi:hypothetical protein